MKNIITLFTAIKTIGYLILLMFLSISNYSIGQVQNIPPELYSSGTLKDSLPVLENDPTTLWKFENETNCEINMSMYFKLQFIENPYTYNEINLPGTEDPFNPTILPIPSSVLYNYFGLPLTSYTMTNLVFDIVINGYRTTVDPYHSVTIPNTPCGCLLWIPNMTTKTFTLKKC